MLKESGDLVRAMLQGSHKRSCFMADIAFGLRQAARMDRELEHVVEIFIRIALRGIGRQKEQFDFILAPVQPGCGLFPMMYL